MWKKEEANLLFTAFIIIYQRPYKYLQKKEKQTDEMKKVRNRPTHRSTSIHFEPTHKLFLGIVFDIELLFEFLYITPIDISQKLSSSVDCHPGRQCRAF